MNNIKYTPRGVDWKTCDKCGFDFSVSNGDYQDGKWYCHFGCYDEPYDDTLPQAEDRGTPNEKVIK